MMRVINILLLGASLLPAQTAAGIEAFHKGDYTRARQILEKSPSSDPRARVFLALARAGSGSCSEAIGDLRKEGTNPDRELRRLAGVTAVQCYVAQGDFNEAYPLLAVLQKDFPGDADVLYQAARVHMRA